MLFEVANQRAALHPVILSGSSRTRGIADSDGRAANRSLSVA
jgi:hypothetical protein